MPNPSLLISQPLVDAKTGIATPMGQKFLWGLAPQHPVMLLITVGASPFIYQSQDRVTTFTVAGGTVSKIEVTTDQQVWADTGVTAGAFALQPFDAIRITHTGAPTSYACYRVSGGQA